MGFEKKRQINKTKNYSKRQDRFFNIPPLTTITFGVGLLVGVTFANINATTIETKIISFSEIMRKEDNLDSLVKEGKKFEQRGSKIVKQENTYKTESLLTTFRKEILKLSGKNIEGKEIVTLKEIYTRLNKKEKILIKLALALIIILPFKLLIRRLEEEGFGSGSSIYSKGENGFSPYPSMANTEQLEINRLTREETQKNESNYNY